jgi:hypothetical protein
VEAAYKLDDVHDALKRGDIAAAAKFRVCLHFCQWLPRSNAKNHLQRNACCGMRHARFKWALNQISIM